MGYTTDFDGEFTLDKPLKAEHALYLHAFSRSRRMKRDAKIAETLSDPVRKAAGLPIGDEGAYYVGGGDGGLIGGGLVSYRRVDNRKNDKSVVDHNESAESQPGVWCQWVPNADVEDIAAGVEVTAIEWDGGETFYAYVKWIEYLIKHFLAPWGYVLNGTVEWSGEEKSDIG